MEPEAHNLVRRILRQKQRAKKRARQAEALATPLPPLPPLETQVHPSFYPDYPENWIDVTEEAYEGNYCRRTQPMSLRGPSIQ